MDASEDSGSHEELFFDPTECRIVGTLLEKAMATPETYPLTVNALIAGCNQKSNRDPRMSLDSFEVEGALMALQIKGAVNVVERLGSRTARYAHRLGERLDLGAPDLAILAELMVRGPQTVNELTTRTRRMGAVFTNEQLEARLRAGAEAPRALFALGARRPGERYPRWRQLLSAESAAAGDESSDHAPSAETRDVRPPAPASIPGGGLAERLTALEARVARLEQALGSEPAAAPSGPSVTPAEARPSEETSRGRAEPESTDWIDVD